MGRLSKLADTPSDPEGISEIHFTGNGAIHLWASPDKAGGWKTRFWGTHLAPGRFFKTAEGANNYLKRSFAEMFPEHVCTAKCGATDENAQQRAAKRHAP